MSREFRKTSETRRIGTVRTSSISRGENTRNVSTRDSNRFDVELVEVGGETLLDLGTGCVLVGFQSESTSFRTSSGTVSKEPGEGISANETRRRESAMLERRERARWSFEQSNEESDLCWNSLRAIQPVVDHEVGSYGSPSESKKFED